MNKTTGVTLGNSAGQPISSQTVVCDAASGNPTPYVVSAAANSANVSVTVLPGAIIKPGVRAIGVVNNSTVLNQGDIQTSANNAFGITSTGSGSTLTNSGTIETTGPNGYGLDARGSGTSLINNGTITTSGENSAGVRTTETTAATSITNSGTINVTGPSTASVYGPGILFQNTAAGSFANLAGGTVTSANDAGVRGGDGAITISNAGTLTGSGTAILLGNGADTIQITAGHVNGAIVAGSGNDHLAVSGGVVNGNVSFGNGANTLALTGGTINGGLSTGAGNDTFLLATGTTLTGPINAGGGTNGLTLAGNGTGSYTGAISNIQSLTKQDAGSWSLAEPVGGLTSVIVSGGTLALPASNGTFTTTLSGGTALVNVATALGSGLVIFDGGRVKAGGAVALSNSAAVNATGGTIDANGYAFTYSGIIANGSGPGGLAVANSSSLPGSVVLAGANTYSGATTVGAGATLALTGVGSVASSSSLADAGIFNIAGHTGNASVAVLTGDGGVVLGANTLSVASGAFTGVLGATGDTGGLVKVGAGTFTFAGGAYSGATTVNSGTLALAGTLANASAVTIGASATLRTDTAGALGPNAAVFDSGVFDLNNHSQTIGALSGTGAVLLGSATLTTATNGSFSGALSGSGGLTKNDSSTLTLAGTSTYTGDTNVNGGILNVTGTLLGTNVVVNAGGTLAGSGQIGDPIINAGGTLAPSAITGTPTTLTMGGPLTLMPGSFYNVTVTPAASDRVAVNGAIDIAGGSVQVAAGGGTFTPQSRYTILTATGGVTGQFAAATSNLAFLTPTLAYDPADVVLVLSRNDLSFASVAATQNQRAVAVGLTNASRQVQSAGSGSVLNAVFSLSAMQAQAAFDSLSGEGIAATQNLAHRESALFTSALFDQTTVYGAGGGNQIVLTQPPPGFVARDRLEAPPIRELADLPRADFIAPVPATPTRSWRAWGSGFGGDETIRSNAATGYAAQSSAVYGGAVGVDYQITPDQLVGFAVGGTDGAFSVPNRATSGSVAGGHLAGYGRAAFGPAYGALSVSGSFFQNRTTRDVAGFGGLASETEKGSFNSREVRLRLEAGRGLPAGPYGVLTPFAALEIASLRSDGFTEQAVAGPGLLPLNVSGQSAADVPGFVGLRYATAATLGSGTTFRPFVQAAYVHEFAPYRQQFAGLAGLPGAVFQVDGARPARNAAQIKAGGELAIGLRAAIFADFDGEFARANQFYGGKGGLKISF